MGSSLVGGSDPSTHRDLLGVSRSYSTWCLRGMRGRMASNSGRRLGSLMTSFRSPTNTGSSMDLRERAEGQRTASTRTHACTHTRAHCTAIQGRARCFECLSLSFLSLTYMIMRTKGLKAAHRMTSSERYDKRHGLMGHQGFQECAINLPIPMGTYDL